VGELGGDPSAARRTSLESEASIADDASSSTHAQTRTHAHTATFPPLSTGERGGVDSEEGGEGGEHTQIARAQPGGGGGGEGGGVRGGGGGGELRTTNFERQ